MPNWTDEQKLAIYKTDCDLIVSASAGTGKTAVLVERIIELLLREQNPAAIDRFLIVTFTEAAAAEMREKIERALRDKLLEKPDSDHLRKQVLLIENAAISTIHAFCSRALRQHFYRIGLDPEFTILAQEEADLLSIETLDAFLQKQFEDLGRPDDEVLLPDFMQNLFVQWIDSFFGSNPMLAAREAILRIHRFLVSLEDPEGWMQKVKDAYPLDEEGKGIVQPFEKFIHHDRYMEWLGENIQAFYEAVNRIYNHALSIEPKTEKMVNALHELAVTLMDELDQKNVTAIIEAIDNTDIPNLGTIRTKDPEVLTLKDELYAIRDSLYKAALAKSFGGMPPELMMQIEAEAAPIIHMILRLAGGFQEAYALAKKQRATLDFSDLEQYALQLFRDDENPGKAGEIAKLYQDQFDYVMIDEYQDVNHVQEAILRMVSRSDDLECDANMFVVGDVKQSIYAFRLAAPELFMERYGDSTPVSPEPSPRKGRVDLRKNFRSRSGILKSVNYLFERLMTQAAAGMPYDEGAILVTGADYPLASPDIPDPLPTEVHLLEDKIDSDAIGDSEILAGDAARREACFVGRRILQMVGREEPGHGERLMVYDSDDSTGGMRPAEFRDIVILFRSTPRYVEEFQDVFQKLGIPNQADSGIGLLASMEVRDILNLLRVIDNPLQDIPLAALLRSPFFGWNESELARIRLARRKAPFYDAMQAFMEERDEPDDMEDDLPEKLSRFIAMLDRWRDLARRKPLADLVMDIFDATQYPSYVLGLDSGPIRKGNLEQLHRIAGRFDQFARRGLARFLRFVDQFQEREGDYGSVSLPGEEANEVRMMTVHKSKGLEFPIVFMCGLGKKFNLLDTYKATLLSRELGMGISITDPNRGIRFKTPAHIILARELARNMRMEELRILYVALTRARERLLLVGSASDLEKKQEAWASPALMQGDSGEMAAREFLTAGTYLDWIMPPLRAFWAGDCEVADGLFQCRFHDADAMKSWEGGIPAVDYTADLVSENAPELSEEEMRGVDDAIERLRWSYPHVALSRHPARISTSELKRRWRGEGEYEDGARAYLKDPQLFRRAGFATPEGEVDSRDARPAFTAAERGSLAHFVLQHLDMMVDNMHYGEISRQIDLMIDSQMLTEDERQAIDIEAIEAFFASDVGQRLKRCPARRMWRELPFLMGLRPMEIGLDDLAAYDNEEVIRAQGVIDCLFEDEDGKLVLVDYKTDRVSGKALYERAQFYKEQLRLYALAIEGAFGRKPEEIYLYFLSARECVSFLGDWL